MVYTALGESDPVELASSMSFELALLIILNSSELQDCPALSEKNTVPLQKKVSFSWKSLSPSIQWHTHPSNLTPTASSENLPWWLPPQPPSWQVILNPLDITPLTFCMYYHYTISFHYFCFIHLKAGTVIFTLISPWHRVSIVRICEVLKWYCFQQIRKNPYKQ